MGNLRLSDKNTSMDLVAFRKLVDYDEGGELSDKNRYMDFVRERKLWLSGLALLPFVLLLCASHCLASGRHSADFLRVGVGARNIALANAGVSGTDVENIYWNPAGLAFVKDTRLSFIHNKHFQDIFYNFAAGSIPWDSPYGECVIAASMQTLDMGVFQGYDDRGNKTHKIKSGNNAATLAVSKKISVPDTWEHPGVSAVGVGVKYINESIASYTADTLAFDIGGMHSWSVQGRPARMGISIHNLAGYLKFHRKAFPLPVIARLGGNIELNLFNNPVILYLQADKTPDSPLNAGIAVEYIMYRMFSIRAGYLSQNNRGAFRWGTGIRISGFSFDYAMGDFGELGYSNTFSISLNFGAFGEDISRRQIKRMKEIETLYNNGMKLYGEGRYPEAILQFDRVLKLDPTNIDALRMMKQSAEFLK